MKASITEQNMNLDSVPIPDYSSMELANHFQKSLKHYREMLDKADLVSAQGLSVAKINQHADQNVLMLEFLGNLYFQIQQDLLLDSCIGVRSVLNKYLDMMQELAENLKKV